VAVWDDDAVSPVSRGRKKKSKSGRPRRNVFEDVLRGFEAFGGVSDPLLAEVSVAGTLEVLAAEQVIEYAGRKADRVALAFLRALEAVGTDEARVVADRLAGAGVAEPGWAGARVKLGECWEFSDARSKATITVVMFERAGARHAVVASGGAVDVAQEPELLLAGLQARAAEGERYTLREISPGRARRLVEESLGETGGQFLVKARLRLMPTMQPYLQGLTPGASQAEIIDTLARRRFAKPGDDDSADSAVVARLWDNDPPELWDAAKRMLDAGQDRQTIFAELGKL
jgi:hypothetical protein